MARECRPPFHRPHEAVIPASSLSDHAVRQPRPRTDATRAEGDGYAPIFQESVKSKSKEDSDLHRRLMGLSTRFNERAPPPNMFKIGGNCPASAASEDGDSDCDSVVSDYQGAPKSDSEGSSSAASAPALLQTSAPLASMRPDVSTASAPLSPFSPSQQLLQDLLPPKGSSSLPEVLPPKEVSTARGAVQMSPPGPKTEGLSPAASSSSASNIRENFASFAGTGSVVRGGGMNAWVSRSGGIEMPVNASTAGEWVTRLQALDEVKVAHRECARRIVDLIERIIPEAELMDPVKRMKLIDVIDAELDSIRQILSRHAQGLLGSDLAELRMIKIEHKKQTDKLTKMNKIYTKELNRLKDQLRETSDIGDEVVKQVTKMVAAQQDYEPMMYLSPEQRSCILTILEDKLKALFSEYPGLEAIANQKEKCRLQEQFTQERLSKLEKQVAELTKENNEARQLVSSLQQHKELLCKEYDKVVAESEQLRKTAERPASRSCTSQSQQSQQSQSSFQASTASDSSGRASPIDCPDGWQFPSAPEGKPRAGRPRRQQPFSSATDGNLPLPGP
jgi:cell division protein FtsB